MRTAAQWPGRGISILLAGVWRRDFSPIDLFEWELGALAPLLLGSGAGALAWLRVKDSPLRTCVAASHLHDAYRLYTLKAAIHSRNLKDAFVRLRSAGVDPLLVKGWAIARHYPEPGLRPYGDLDLCVRPRDYEAARLTVDEIGGAYPVDLHYGADTLGDRSLEELLERSVLVRIDDVDIRIPAPEDHLRILCLHLLRHGGVRPLWLCDIAVAVERRSPGFDWDLCLGGDPRRSEWVECAIGLAHRLLGAAIDDTPPASQARHLPRWLVPAVLKEWSEPLGNRAGGPYESFSESFRRPWKLAQALRERWPNPIQASMDLGAPFNAFPRLPLQLASYVSRSVGYARRLASPGLGNP